MMLMMTLIACVQNPSYQDPYEIEPVHIEVGAYIDIVRKLEQAGFEEGGVAPSMSRDELVSAAAHSPHMRTASIAVVRWRMVIVMV